ncbi:CvpA family protein [Acidimangrovimonas pyrenivorans]|uniref:CvpA family protein n=1 Tax=Acidimangrovimonas pyrenivorans TaxID=2030798 RepID=A0ABV7AGL9_9RHOB
MEGFTVIDAVVAVVIVLSAILAYSRGFVREVMAIAGWIAAAVLAYIFAPQAEPLIKEIPVLDKFLAGSCELSIVAAFAAVFALGLVIMSFFTPLFSSVVRHSVLAGIDQGLGFLFGVARGLLLVAVAFVVYDRAMANEAIPMVSESRSAKIFQQFQANIDQTIPTDAPGWIVQRYEHLVGNCGAPASGSAAPTTPPANAPADGTATTGN